MPHIQFGFTFKGQKCMISEVFNFFWLFLIMDTFYYFQSNMCRIVHGYVFSYIRSNKEIYYYKVTKITYYINRCTQHVAKTPTAFSSDIVMHTYAWRIMLLNISACKDSFIVIKDGQRTLKDKCMFQKESSLKGIKVLPNASHVALVSDQHYQDESLCHCFCYCSSRSSMYRVSSAPMWWTWSGLCWRSWCCRMSLPWLLLSKRL